MKFRTRAALTGDLGHRHWFQFDDGHAAREALGNVFQQGQVLGAREDVLAAAWVVVNAPLDAWKQFGGETVTDALPGAITFVQRSDSSLRLWPHFHTLAADGAWVRSSDRTLSFHALGEPTAQELAQVAAWTHARLLRFSAPSILSLSAPSSRANRGTRGHGCFAKCWGNPASGSIRHPGRNFWSQP